MKVPFSDPVPDQVLSLDSGPVLTPHTPRLVPDPDSQHIQPVPRRTLNRRGGLSQPPAYLSERINFVKVTWQW